MVKTAPIQHQRISVQDMHRPGCQQHCYNQLMKNLGVQTFYQEENSADCGPIAARMILHYFGIEKSDAELKRLMTYDPNGTSIYDNGLRCLEEGLKATLITANPRVFHKEIQGKLKTKDALLKFLSAYQRKHSKKKGLIKLFKDFVSKGGKVRIEIPSFDHVKNAIDKNQLVLALLYGRALGLNEGAFHFVVVSGYKKNAVFINNPLPGSRTGWFPLSDFMYALCSSTCFDVDNGSLLIVGK